MHNIYEYSVSKNPLSHFHPIRIEKRITSYVGDINKTLKYGDTNWGKKELKTITEQFTLEIFMKLICLWWNEKLTPLKQYNDLWYERGKKRMKIE